MNKALNILKTLSLVTIVVIGIHIHLELKQHHEDIRAEKKWERKMEIKKLSRLKAIFRVNSEHKNGVIDKRNQKKGY